MTGEYLFALISERPGAIPRGGNEPLRTERRVEGFYVSESAATEAAEASAKNDTHATYYVMKTFFVTKNCPHTTRVETP